MTDRVLREGLALSSNGVVSQNDAAPRSAMAAPLIVFDRALGFVYLETTKSDIFDAGHLHMLVIIAAIAATVLENARHLQRLEKAAGRSESAACDGR
ncbi:MAG TPA: GAF domain-containing protein [Terriglobales bacterium]|nr:GAF domain-containing protein [Terriglobales bacterium]